MVDKLCTVFTWNQTFSLFPNETINRTVNALIVKWIPLMSVEKIIGKEIKYRFCGPLMALFREYIYKDKVNVQLLIQPEMLTANFLFESTINNETDILIFPAPPHKSEIDYMNEHIIRTTKVIDYHSLGHIGSLTKPGLRPEYIYFLSLEPPVWLALLIALIFIALFMAFLKKNVKTFFSIIWQFSTVLLSDYMTKIPNSIRERFITVIWLLMAGVVIYSAFTGCLWGFMIQKTPVQKIDSWTDLYEMWNYRKIIAVEFDIMCEFSTYDESDMAKNFKSRIYCYSPEEFMNETFVEEIMDMSSSDEYVFVFEYHGLQYSKRTSNIIQEKKKKKFFRNGVDYHISNLDTQYMPYRLDVSNNQKINMTTLDRTITQLKESGIYEHWKQEMMDRNGRDEQLDEDVVINDIEPLTLENLSGVFKILIYGLFAGFIVFILEWVYFLFLDSKIVTTQLVFEILRSLKSRI